MVVEVMLVRGEDIVNGREGDCNHYYDFFWAKSKFLCILLTIF